MTEVKKSYSFSATIRERDKKSGKYKYGIGKFCDNKEISFVIDDFLDLRHYDLNLFEKLELKILTTQTTFEL
jgi:hypothetical protein